MAIKQMFLEGGKERQRNLRVQLHVTIFGHVFIFMFVHLFNTITEIAPNGIQFRGPKTWLMFGIQHCCSQADSRTSKNMKKNKRHTNRHTHKSIRFSFNHKRRAFLASKNRKKSVYANFIKEIAGCVFEINKTNTTATEREKQEAFG